jgi:hypothetical protein
MAPYALLPVSLVAVAVYRGLLGTATKLYEIDVGTCQREVSTVNVYLSIWAFAGGLVSALVCSLVVMAALYAQFSRTLRHEKEVFDYPSVLPVRS